MNKTIVKSTDVLSICGFCGEKDKDIFIVFSHGYYCENCLEEVLKTYIEIKNNKRLMEQRITLQNAVSSLVYVKDNLQSDGLLLQDKITDEIISILLDLNSIITRIDRGITNE